MLRITYGSLFSLGQVEHGVTPKSPLSQLYLFSALEGILLYRALTKVFDDAESRNWLLYVTGYGVPFLAATFPFVIAILLEDPEYTM